MGHGDQNDLTTDSRPGGRPSPDRVLAGGGEMGALMRSVDWSETSLGPVEGWPQSLRTAVSIVLESGFAMVVAWGPEFILLYNDRYRPVLGATKHPAALGRPTRAIFPEIWHVIGPLFEQAARGEAVALDDVLLPLDRNGYLEECFFTLSYSPIRDESGGVGGLLAVVVETTERVQAERRLRTLRDLAGRAAEAKSAPAACRNAAETLARNSADVPFALLYLIDDDGRAARLVASAGIEPGLPASPVVVDLDAPPATATATAIAAEGSGWPLVEVLAEGGGRTLSDLPRRFGPMPGGAYPEPAHTALVLPMSRPGQPRPYGFFVAGVSPRRALDDKSRTFLELAAEHIVTGISNARAYEEERRRAEALAEIDRAKTAFFSNVSHEFRTPLTLMLGPAEDLLDGRYGDLGDGARAQVAVLRHNGMRMLKLVNSLLDFARIEAGRVDAVYERVKLGEMTAELASSFRAAVERAGLTLTVDCPEPADDVYVDREMWEKIVLNLLSNAFKFTFAGGISVSLGERAAGAGGRARVELTVRDTGTGIPADELPKLFTRFHRVKAGRARTHEGSGIGLALVQELVRLHGGTIDVESVLGHGTSFRVAIPAGAAHLPPERVGAVHGLASTAIGAAPFVDEALRWVPGGSGEARAPGPPVASRSAPAAPASTAPAAPLPAAAPGRGRGRVLIVDDNHDMREYLRRLLSAHWQIDVASDGAEALALARNPERTPDLVLSDVMMPNVDGFELVRRLREDARTRALPVILLSARAGEEARVEGVDTGADDYLVKPFSARELLARVRVHLEMARLRAAADRSKDQFLAMLGHELRNPLAAIVAAVQLMRLRGDPERRSERELAVIDRQVRHLGRLVDDLLDISRITRGKIELRREPVELGQVIARGVEIAAPLIQQRQHQLAVEVKGAGLRVSGDPVRLAQVFGNLLTNAARYTDPGGRIRVTAAPRDADVVVTVADNGVGIAGDVLPVIFDLFVQGERSPEQADGGLGIGLTLVRSLVELHGGVVRAHSDGPDLGSAFTVQLPLLPPEEAAAAERADAASADAGAGPGQARAASPARRVLIVDDNRDAAMLLAQTLREVGHDVRVAHDAVEALSCARDLRPEVALVDIGLPLVDGYQLARQLREQAAGAPLRLVALTGYGREDDHKRSVAEGFDAHLVKPVDLDRVLGAVGGPASGRG